MSVGFQLRARAKSGGGDAAGCFERLVAAVEGRWPEAVCWQTDEGGVHVSLNPALGPIEIRWEADGEVEFEATTSSGGPGFHQAAIEVCERIAAACELELLLEDERTLDETGYLVSRSRSDVEESMLAWLRSVMRLVTMQSPGAAYAGRVGMVTGPQSRAGGYIQTPLGPQSESWALAFVAEPWPAREFFVWWDEGRTAEVLRNAAISLMWREVWWDRVDLGGNRETQSKVLSLLREAYALDPVLEYPWREWEEILGYQGQRENEELHRRIEVESARATGRLIGYRRGDVEHWIGGWRITLPGSFRDWGDKSVLFAMDGSGREVHLDLTNDERDPRQTRWIALELPDVYEVIAVVTEGDAPGVAVWCPIWPEGGALPALVARFLKGGSDLMLVVRCRDAGDREWADGVWRSLK